MSKCRMCRSSNLDKSSIPLTDKGIFYGYVCVDCHREWCAYLERIGELPSGNYYVSVQEAGRTGLLLGPFLNYQTASVRVSQARLLAERVDSRAVFYKYGISKMPYTYVKSGVLNHLLNRS